MSAYYNEIDRGKAAWLRELIKAGVIAPGEIDTRGIKDVRADDLRGFVQHHFFAGIGVWSYALRLAGWPDDRPVWTGSCPCQPFSAAGKRKGTADERHLWPAWFRLIEELRPPVVFGEQVASKGGLAWLDIVWSDLEGQGYAVGAVDISACGFGAPHIRQRLYFVGELEHPVGSRIGGGSERGLGSLWQEVQEHKNGAGASIESCDGSEDARLLAESCVRAEQREPGKLLGAERPEAGRGNNGHRRSGPARLLADAAPERIDGSGNGGPGRRGESSDHCELGNADSPSPSRLGEDGGQGEAQGRLRCGPCNGFWSDSVWLPCRDGKARPTKPGIFPLVDGATKRVGHCGDTGLEVNATPEARVLRLRGYGDAIVAPVAAEFIMAYCSCEQKLCVMRGSEEDDDA